MKKTTAIVGLGITGLSSLEFLHGSENLVVIDTRDAPPQLQKARTRFPEVDYRLGTDQVDYTGVDRVLVSPGVDLNAAVLDRARALGIPLVSDIELFMQAVTKPVLAITGTNGKSTVTELVGDMLQLAGLSPGVGGNLGVPALSLLAAVHQTYVLELSSFQLERLPESLNFHAVAVLNISDDHMDRYPTFADYVAAKHKIYHNAGLRIFNREDSHTIPRDPNHHTISVGFDRPIDANWGITTSPGVRSIVLGNKVLLNCDDLSLQGPHNELNAMTAAALAQSVAVSDEVICTAWKRFVGLAHRCQTVLKVAGVTYVNDSKATNVGACLAALDRFYTTGKRVVLIAGGEGKNADFTPLRDALARGVKKLVLLGEDAPVLQELLGDVVHTLRVKTMAEAVQAANEEAICGDVVLLAPACASFDMYANYVERGEDFERRVRAVQS